MWIKAVVFCVFVIVSASIFNTMSYAEQFKVGIINHPPYQMTDSEQFTGIYIDVFREISKETGDTFIFKFFPVARLKVQFTNGQVDIEPGINPSWRQNEPIRGEYTLPFAKSIDIALFNKGDSIPINGPESLPEKSRVGVVRGYFYPGFMESFDKGRIIRDISINEFKVLKKLAVNRYHIAFINKAVARYWISNDPTFKNFEIGSTIGVADIMLRVHPSKKQAVERFNKAIEKLIKNNKIDAIFAKYQ